MQFVEILPGIIKIFLFAWSCLKVEECRLLGFVIIYNVGKLGG